jgi:hypothetical protein
MPTNTRNSRTKSTPRKPAKVDKAGGISSDAVKAKTGKSWDQWFAILDKAGAKAMAHKDIAALLHESHDVSGWWSQMITVGYEQVRLGRAKGEKASGDFSVSASKTINVPVATLYKAWADTRARRAWLDEDIQIRTKTPNKSIRITWSDGKTHVAVGFIDKGPAKSQVGLEHSKIRSAKEADRIKAAWRPRLEALKARLEGAR